MLAMAYTEGGKGKGKKGERGGGRGRRQVNKSPPGKKKKEWGRGGGGKEEGRERTTFTPLYGFPSLLGITASTFVLLPPMQKVR